MVRKPFTNHQIQDLMMKYESTMEDGKAAFGVVPPPFQAGEWTVDPALNSLRNKHEERHVEPKVMKVLLVLAARQNHVVPKEELMAAVWPDTFVSDDVLTRCISVLRRVTHDDPHEPRFIQTIPKVGYRLVAEIRDMEATVLESVPEPEPPPAIAPAAVSALQQRSSQLQSALLLAGAGLLLVLVAVVAAFFWTRRSAESTDAIFRTLPFTSRSGEQLQPAFSPDGQTVAYVQLDEKDGSRHLYLKRVGSESAAALTSGEGDDYSPAWSPDGKEIAYFARTGDQLGLYLVSVRQPTPRRIFIPQQETQWEQNALSWSPDGKTLVFPDHTGSSPNSSIDALDVATGQVRALTAPPTGWEGDLTPAWSPDGKRIAFTRASETAVRDIYWVSPTDPTVHVITDDHSNIDSIAWAADGKSILFSSNRGGKFALWKMRLSGHEPERLPFGTEDAFQPAVSGDGKKLAYTQGSAVWSIVRLTADHAAGPVLSSTQQDSAPSLSPDSERFAFQSQRSGSQEIWTARADGSDLRQITHQGGQLTGSPAWSHTGNDVLLDSRVGGHSHIFLIPASGGAARQLTSGDANDIVPRWSQDDATVYFRSNRGGRWQLWRVPLAGGDPQPVTTGDGIAPQESLDGRLLYYTRGGEDGLWSVPLAGGAEKQVLAQPLAGFWGYWQVTQQGIFYLDHINGQMTIRIFHPESGRSTLFAKAPVTTPTYAGLTVSQDGKAVWMTDEAQAGRHITLVEATSGKSLEAETRR